MQSIEIRHRSTSRTWWIPESPRTHLRTLAVVGALVLASVLRGQELLWEVHSQSGVSNGGCLPYFGDYDHDGSQDLLVVGWDYRLPYPWPIIRVLSGTDGRVLTEMLHPYYSTGVQSIGDFDGDSVPDIALGGGGFIEVWSLVDKVRLLRFPLPVLSGPYGSTIRGVDCTGDGLRDFVYAAPNGTIYVYDHFGAILYTIPANAMGFIPADIAAVGDLDGDGAEDFIVGAVEWYTGLVYGAVILVSGRTGTPLRFHWGPQPFDGINSDVRAAGDVDGDGVMDYAAGNKGGYRGVIMIWSGATGALIRQWTVPVGELAGAILAGQDVDLDGRPDIICMAPAYLNSPGPPALHGRVRTLSSRDGQDLIHVASQQWTNWWGQSYADLGVQPGNPYPVFVVMDDPVVPPYNNYPRIRAYRCTPAGTRFVGTGCTSTTTIPTIGIRRVDGTPNDGSRLVLGSAPENAFAVCVLAPATTSIAGGLTTPVPLGVLGMPGCQLLVPPAMMVLRATGSAGMDRGYAAFDFPLPMVATGGALLAAQWVVLDPSTLAHGTTARYEFRVQ